jgi:hypothetical protein
VVNFDDYARADSGFNNNRTGWFNGDFDYNGVVNFDDYSLLDLAFNTQGSPLQIINGDGNLGWAGDLIEAPMPAGLAWAEVAPMVVDRNVRGGQLSAVPEPASTSAAAGLISMTLPARRRRRDRRGAMNS